MAEDLFGGFDVSRINPRLIDEVRRAAALSGVRSFGGITGNDGHRALTTSGHPSRHKANNALDFALLNGLSPLTPEGKALAEKYAAAAQGLGYTRNRESGNARAILFGFNDPARGGNHLNHIHQSYRSDLDTGGGRGAIPMANTATIAPGRSQATKTTGKYTLPFPGFEGFSDNTAPSGKVEGSPLSLLEQVLSGFGTQGSSPNPNDVPSVDAADPLQAARAGLGVKLRYTPRENAQLLDYLALRDQPDPNAMQVSSAHSNADYLKAREALLQKLGPPVPENQMTLPPPVERTRIPYPDRAALPRNEGADIATAVMSVLFPSLAGRLSHENLSAATAEQAAQDRQRHGKFEYDREGAAQAYDDAVRRQNQEMQSAALNSQIAQRNAERGREFGIETGDIPLQAQRQSDLIKALEGDTNARRAASESMFRASTADQNVLRNDQASSASAAARNELQKALIGITPALAKTVYPKPLDAMDQANIKKTNLESMGQLLKNYQGLNEMKGIYSPKDAAELAKIQAETGHITALTGKVGVEKEKINAEIKKLQESPVKDLSKNAYYQALKADRKTKDQSQTNLLTRKTVLMSDLNRALTESDKAMIRKQISDIDGIMNKNASEQSAIRKAMEKMEAAAGFRPAEATTTTPGDLQLQTPTYKVFLNK